MEKNEYQNTNYRHNYSRNRDLTPEELSARGKEQFNGWDDEKKHEFKGRYYDYDHKPTFKKLANALNQGKPIIAIHITTFGKNELNYPMQIGIDIMECLSDGHYRETDQNEFTVDAPKDILNKAQESLHLFNPYEYNGLPFSQYLDRKTDVEIVKKRIQAIINDYPNAEVITFNRSYNEKAISPLGLTDIIGTIDMMGVANEANDNISLFKGKSSIENIANNLINADYHTDIRVGMPKTALEKAKFVNKFIQYIIDAKQIEVGADKDNSLSETRPNDTITIEDVEKATYHPETEIRNMMGNGTFDEPTIQRTQENMTPAPSGRECPKKDGLNFSDLEGLFSGETGQNKTGNIFSDRHGATMDVVTADNVQKIGETNIPHVEESMPFKEAMESGKEIHDTRISDSGVSNDYLKEICESLKVIMKQNEVIMQSLSMSGKTMEQVTNKSMTKEEEHRRNGEDLDKNSIISSVDKSTKKHGDEGR